MKQRDDQFSKNFSFIKKGAQYFCLQSEKFILNDTLHYTSPCNYSAFLRQWNVTEQKSIFPYQRFGSIEELEATVQFPSHESFHSDLTNSNVTQEEYNVSKIEFERRQQLPDSHKDKMFNMRCWLKHYNTVDVVPLASAMNTCFECFHSYFEQDANCQLSLPGIAANAMYRYYNQDCSYIFSFRQKNNEIRVKHRDTLCGGLVNCFHRMVNLTDESGPVNSFTAPNGEKLSHFEQLDFNSLYGAMQMRRLPTTPGILWKLTGKQFKKSIMADQTSLPAVQWIYYLQATAPYLTKKDGTRGIIQQAYHQGEKRLGWDKVDGYCVVDGVEYIFEFWGCFHHGCKCQKNPNLEAREKTMMKEARLKRLGTLISCWECNWYEILAIDPTITPTITHFPHILKVNESEQELIEHIKDGSFFGFIEADLT